MNRSRVRSFLAGVLIANSAPHIASALVGRGHLTPLAGRRSGPGTNAAWGMGNLATGAMLLAISRNRRGHRWNEDLVAFEAGYAVLATWMVGSELVLRINHDRGGVDGHDRPSTIEPDGTSHLNPGSA